MYLLTFVENQNTLLALLFHTEWKDFYTTTSPTTKTYDTNDLKSPLAFSSNTYIKNSLFVNCIYSGNGGCVSFSNLGIYVLIELTSFYLYHAYSGGCVYAKYCHCAINCVCCLKCYATSYGQSICTDLNTTPNNRENYLIQSSVCSDASHSGNYYPLSLCYGYQNCSLVNLSNYYTSFYSGILFNYGSSNPSNVSYCSIKSNHAEQNTCLGFDASGVSYNVERCNIIKNTQGINSEGIIKSYKPIKIIECCFIENTGPMFYCDGKWGGTMTLINCTLPTKYSVFTTSSGSLNTRSAKAQIGFIFALNITANGIYCQSGWDFLILPAPRCTCCKSVTLYNLGSISLISAFIQLVHI